MRLRLPRRSVKLNAGDLNILIMVLRQAQDDLGAPDTAWKKRMADDMKRIENELWRGMPPPTVAVDNGSRS